MDIPKDEIREMSRLRWSTTTGFDEKKEKETWWILYEHFIGLYEVFYEPLLKLLFIFAQLLIFHI